MNKFRILLIDADPERLEKSSSMLEEADHTVLPVSSLEEAEEALFVLKIEVAIFGSSFSEVETEIFVDRLRGIENTQKNARRAPILAVSPLLMDPAGWTLANGGIFDGYLMASFNSEILSAAVEGISSRGFTVISNVEKISPEDLPMFEPEKFRQQVAYDPELTIEIIDLFLEERSVELPEMRAVVESGGSFQRLSELAHTIKGSLSSLHATRARHHAQELESAAKHQDQTACRDSLKALTKDLDSLEPLLLNLRNEVKQ